MPEKTDDQGTIPLSQIRQAAGFLSTVLPGDYHNAARETIVAAALWLDTFYDSAIDTDD